MQSCEQINFCAQVVEGFKRLYSEKKETIEYMCKFGTPIEKAKATLIRDIALQG